MIRVGCKRSRVGTRYNKQGKTMRMQKRHYAVQTGVGLRITRQAGGCKKLSARHAMQQHDICREYAMLLFLMKSY